jgi:hypothetical protein
VQGHVLIRITIPDYYSDSVNHGEHCIRVGAELQDYGIHKSLICDASKYFRAAFTSGFEEAKSGIMTLGTIELRTFGLSYGWLYSYIIWDENSGDVKPDYMALAKLSVFADMTQLVLLKKKSDD